MERNAALAIMDKLRIATIDHMTHIDNLDSIFEHGLLAHNNPYKKIDISNQEVNQRRNRKEPIYNRNTHDYVPLYFNPRNAMLYRNQKQFGDAIVILAFKKDTILLENTLFTNGNAASDGTKCSNDISELELKDWNWPMIWSSSWNDSTNADEVKWSMMAEVLVYQKLEMSQLQEIYCSSQRVESYIKNRYNLQDIKVAVNTDVFF